MTSRPRLLRSHLFVPGGDERLLPKVFDAGADAVVIDLEDAVAAPRKAGARRLVSATLRARGRVGVGPLVFVRINSVESGLWRDDLEAVVGPGLDGVRISKCESAGDVMMVDGVLSSLETDRGLPPLALAVAPTIESARALLASAAIAASPRVLALAFGATDFLADVHAGADAGELETLYARSHLVAVSRAAGIQPPIASVHTRLDDLDGLRRTTEAARRLGMFGRSCIHPTQLAVVHDVFTPRDDEVAGARALLAEAARAGKAAFARADGQFVDRAVVARAAAVVALAERLQAAAQVEETH